jgi:hypothetical protein
MGGLHAIQHVVTTWISGKRPRPIRIETCHIQLLLTYFPDSSFSNFRFLVRLAPSAKPALQLSHASLRGCLVRSPPGAHWLPILEAVHNQPIVFNFSLRDVRWPCDMANGGFHENMNLMFRRQIVEAEMLDNMFTHLKSP